MTQPKQIYRGNHARNLLPAVTATLDSSGKRVFTKQELVRLVGKHREQWHIIDSASSNDVIEVFLTALPLRKFVLESSTYTHEFPRYLWRDPDPLEVASVRTPNSYL